MLTTIEQCNLAADEAAIVGLTDGSHKSYGVGNYTLTNVAWVQHNNVTYAIGAGVRVVLQVQCATPTYSVAVLVLDCTLALCLFGIVLRCQSCVSSSVSLLHFNPMLQL